MGLVYVWFIFCSLRPLFWVLLLCPSVSCFYMCSVSFYIIFSLRDEMENRYFSYVEHQVGRSFLEKPTDC